jgi:hypothetical protein
MHPRFHTSTLKVIALTIITSLGWQRSDLTAQAATRTWNGGGGATVTWNTAANWGGTAPASWDDLIFAGTTSLAPNNNFAANTVFSSITFDASAGVFVTNGNVISLANGITDNAAGNETFGNGVVLLIGNHAISNTGTGALTLSGGTDSQHRRHGGFQQHQQRKHRAYDC